MTKRSVLAAAMTGSWLAAVGCDDLPPLQQGVCGNQIIEPGEQCDTFPPSTEGGCRAPGSVGECRFDCAGTVDGARPSCPDGYACGVDGLCRRPQGTFEERPGEPFDDALFLDVADFDGDGRDDLVTVGAGATQLTFFDDAGGVEATYRFGAFPSRPAIADMDGDGRPDLASVLQLIGGISLQRSATGRRLVPIATTPFNTAGLTSGPVLLVDIGSDFTDGGEDAVLVFNDDLLFSSATERALFQLPGTVENLAAPPRAAAISPALPCEQFVLAYDGRAEVDVVTPCNALGFVNFDLVVTLPPVELADGATVDRGLYLSDGNGDGLVDLAVGTDLGVHVAYGYPDGSFGSAPPADPRDPGESGDGVTVASLGLASELLAAGDVNGDGRFDFVFADAIEVSDSRGGPDETRTIHETVGEPYARAEVGDFNGNGFVDVVVGYERAAKVDFFNGSSEGGLNRFEVVTPGPAARFELGDFDGDTLTDLVFTRTVEGDGNVSSLEVLFGRAATAPESPVSVALVSDVDRLAVGEVLSNGDSLSDILLLTAPGTDPSAVPDAALFVGSTARQLSSPFFLPGEDFRFPFDVSLGDFDGDGRSELSILSLELDASRPGEELAVRWLHLPLGPGGTATADAVVDGDTLPLELEVNGARSLPVELDGEPGTELLVVGASGADSLMLVGKLRGGVPRFADAVRVPGYTLALQLTELDATDTFNAGDYSVPVLADLDADGALDWLSIAVPSTAGADEDTPGQVVLFVPGASGSFDGAAATSLAWPEGEPRAVTLLEADGDSRPEAAVLTEGGLWLADIVVDDAALEPIERLSDAPFEDEVVTLRTGDFDGDGVDDLVVGDTFGFTLLLGGERL